MAHDSDPTLTIDGNSGEGGGQIIRSALALSMLTGRPIEINNIRAGRAKPGLMRQHLVSVQASQAISKASVTGAKLGSSTLQFTPQAIDSGDYSFDIGSAGSTSLVLQTILPALLFANSSHQQPSTVTIKGGTHNPFAPTTDFLQHAFIPAISKLGMQVTIQLLQSGFAPIGGGKIAVTIWPFMRHVATQPFDLTGRANLIDIELVASHLNLNDTICQRELTSATASLIEAGVNPEKIKTKSESLAGIGEGNSCYAIVTHKLSELSDIKSESNHFHSEVFTLLGNKHTRAEKIGHRLAGLIKRYLYQSDAVVDKYLTDQLLLPLALSGGGEFTARIISQHTKTQAWLISQFLPVDIVFAPSKNHHTLVKVIC